MSALLFVPACLAGSALIVWLLSRACRKPTYRELMRWQGNDDGKARYDARLKAAGEAPVRNVRNKEPA